MAVLLKGSGLRDWGLGFRVENIEGLGFRV